MATRYAQIGVKLDTIPKLIELVVDANTRAATFFRSQIASVPTVQAIPSSTVSEAQHRIAETRGGINALISVFDSLQVGESDADAMIAKFREDLSALDQVLAPREKVLVAIQAGDAQGASSLLKQVRSDPEGRLARQLNSFALRTTAFAQMAETKKLEHGADLKARSVRRSDYQRRIYFLILSTGYMSAFLVVVLRAWRDRPTANDGADAEEWPRPGKLPNRLQRMARLRRR